MKPLVTRLLFGKRTPRTQRTQAPSLRRCFSSFQSLQSFFVPWSSCFILYKTCAKFRKTFRRVLLECRLVHKNKNHTARRSRWAAGTHPPPDDDFENVLL